MTDQVAYSENYKPPKWYNWYRFPLVPMFRYRPADAQNNSDWHLQWLALRVWTAMPPQLGLEFEINDRELMFKLLLPYLYVGLFFPLFPERWSQKSWRVPKRSQTASSGPKS